MLIINYVHKLQGLDKSLPVCLELREQLGARVFSLIELEPGCLETDVRAFQPLIEACSDASLILAGTHRSRRRGRLVALLDRWQNRNLPGSRLIDALKVRLMAKPLRYQIENLKRSDDDLLLLSIYNGVNTSLGAVLARLTRRLGGLRVGYLKSLHDQGLGLSDLSSSSANLTRRLVLEPTLDALLVPALPQFQALLAGKGVRIDQMIIAGYPPAYQRWRDLVRSHALRNHESSGFQVVLFTRGEVAHKPASEQIIDDHWLHQAIRNLTQELERLWPGFSLLIKPHPYQKRDELQRICGQHRNLSLVDGPPCLLAAHADLAIATYSSAILDAVAVEVPSIEWYEPTDAFRRLHPDGSPFPAFGVLPASNLMELRSHLESLAAGEWPTCDKINKLGVSLDLAPFRRSHDNRAETALVQNRGSDHRSGGLLHHGSDDLLGAEIHHQSRQGTHMESRVDPRPEQLHHP
jgi:hypothetical protein